MGQRQQVPGKKSKTLENNPKTPTSSPSLPLVYASIPLVYETAIIKSNKETVGDTCRSLEGELTEYLSHCYEFFNRRSNVDSKAVKNRFNSSKITL